MTNERVVTIDEATCLTESNPTKPTGSATPGVHELRQCWLVKKELLCEWRIIHYGNVPYRNDLNAGGPCAVVCLSSSNRDSCWLPFKRGVPRQKPGWLASNFGFPDFWLGGVSRPKRQWPIRSDGRVAHDRLQLGSADRASWRENSVWT